jgi:hypothetical protein
MLDVEAKFMSVEAMAVRLNLPETWLRGEAQAGRLPSLLIDKRLHFPVAEVEAELLARARRVDPTTTVAQLVERLKREGALNG